MIKNGMHIIGTAKQTLKEKQNSKSPIIKLTVSSMYGLWNSFQSIRRMIVDAEYRSILLLQLVSSRKVHQTTPLTYMNRYPKIFSACQEYFKGKENIKILSYGCSTGEEVLTLRQYFPTAQIIGAEINKRSLAICKKHSLDNKISFIHSRTNEIQKHGPFDAVFCMAVLQRQPHYIKEKGITSLKKIYPFEKFEQQIIELDHLINLGGLLIVHFTQYSLLDTVVASEYKALGDYNQDDYLSPVFDRNSNIIKNPASQYSIFIKENE